MAGAGAGYDLSVTTFSPDGQVHQVNYAKNASDNGATVIAACCKDGIIFAVDKELTSKLMVAATDKRIFPVNRHTTLALSGYTPDARMIVNRAQSEAKQYLSSYADEIPLHVLAERIGLYMHAHTLYWSVRPFGVSVLLGGVDTHTQAPALYCIEPNGVCFKYHAKAIGKGRKEAVTGLEKCGVKEATCKEALVPIVKILLGYRQEAADQNSGKSQEAIDVAWICEPTKFVHKQVSAAEMTEAKEAAKRALDAEENEED